MRQQAQLNAHYTAKYPNAKALQTDIDAAEPDRRRDRSSGERPGKPVHIAGAKEQGLLGI